MPAEILIVDGDVGRLNMLQDVLQTVGYGVTGSRSAQDALEVINPTTHKLVFINLQLPDLSGTELLRELRPIVPNARAVFLAEGEDLVAQQEVRGMGVHKWLYLPVRPDEVIRCAAEILEQASLADGNKTEESENQVRRNSPAVARRLWR